MITGEIDDPSGFVEFTLPRSVKRASQERSLRSFRHHGRHRFAKSVLKPTVILVPKEESCLSPGDNSAASGHAR